jgi:hypothetical protein
MSVPKEGLDMVCQKKEFLFLMAIAHRTSFSVLKDLQQGYGHCRTDMRKILARYLEEKT